jgi:hypothetical protein
MISPSVTRQKQRCDGIQPQQEDFPSEMTDKIQNSGATDPQDINLCLQSEKLMLCISSSSPLSHRLGVFKRQSEQFVFGPTRFPVAAVILVEGR